jgi:hypothetical protein
MLPSVTRWAANRTPKQSSCLRTSSSLSKFFASRSATLRPFFPWGTRIPCSDGYNALVIFISFEALTCVPKISPKWCRVCPTKGRAYEAKTWRWTDHSNDQRTGTGWTDRRCVSAGWNLSSP